MNGCLAYILQAHKEDQLYLCVMDDANGQYHRFPLSVLAASRLAAECAGVVNMHMGGYNAPLVLKSPVEKVAG